MIGLLLSFATTNLNTVLVAWRTVEAECARYALKVEKNSGHFGRRNPGGTCLMMKWHTPSSPSASCAGSSANSAAAPCPCPSPCCDGAVPVVPVSAAAASCTVIDLRRRWRRRDDSGESGRDTTAAVGAGADEVDVDDDDDDDDGVDVGVDVGAFVEAADVAACSAGADAEGLDGTPADVPSIAALRVPERRRARRRGDSDDDDDDDDDDGDDDGDDDADVRRGRAVRERTRSRAAWSAAGVRATRSRRSRDTMCSRVCRAWWNGERLRKAA